jgi:CAAX protease family protein
MNTMNALNIKRVIPKEELKPIMILFLSSLIPAIHKCFGSIEFIRNILPGISENNAVMYLFVSTFVLFGIVPVMIIITIFKESPKDYGINFGDWKKGLGYIAILFPLIAVLIIYPSSFNSELANFYPQSKAAGGSAFLFLKYETLHILLFYSGWEILFRGFMLFGLRKYVGDSMAIFIQIIPSCLWHLGMATGEIFGALVGGILFGVMALKTRSILYPFILHFLIGVTLDLLIVLNI